MRFRTGSNGSDLERHLQIRPAFNCTTTACSFNTERLRNRSILFEKVRTEEFIILTDDFLSLQPPLRTIFVL